MNKINICLSLIWISFSCNNQGFNNKHLTISDFPIKEKLHVEYIIPSIVVAPVFFAIQANYLCTYSLKKDTMIDMYSLPDLVHKKSFGIRGEGPDEFQSFPWPCKSTNNDLYIRGYTPLLIKQFTVDSYTNPIQKHEYILKEYESFGSMHIVRDSLLIYSSMGHQNDTKEQISIKKYNLNLKQEIGRILIPTSSPENTSIDPNRAGGFDVNDSFIVYAYLFKKQIDIYNIHNMELSCRLKGNVKEVQTDKEFKNNIPHYQGVIAGKRYFYALYNKKGYKISELEPAGQTIEVFDYSGNTIAEYSFDDHISLFALDEINHVLYAYDATKEDYILKYNLPKSIIHNPEDTK